MIGARIQRGFRRLGIFLGAPFFVGGAAMLIMYAIPTDTSWWKNDPIVAKRNYFDRFDPPKKSSVFDDLPRLSCPAVSAEAVVMVPREKSALEMTDAEICAMLELKKREGKLQAVDFDPFKPTRDPTALYWAGGLTASGVIIFVFCAGLGWIFAGFARE